MRCSLSWIVVAAISMAIVLTAIVVIIAVNFKTPEKTVRHAVQHCHGIKDKQFELEMDAMLGPDMLEGNTITALQNGDEIFPPMLSANRSATLSITFETYIYWSGEVGKRLLTH